jgi:cell division protein FtsB
MKSRSYMQGPGLSAGRRAAVVVAMLVGAYLIFEFGRIQADYNIVDSIAEQQALKSEIGGLEDQIVELKQEIALLETHRVIDREAYQVVETNLTDLQRKIQEQQDAIAFYRGIVSPKDGGRGLRVQDLKLTRGKDERHYNLRLVLVQVMQHDRSVKGEVDFSLEGALNGVATSYKLEELLPEDGNSSWPFAFRYFQDFDRELVLPDGFMPEKINVEVVSRTKSIASVKQSFDWPAGQS